MGSSCKGSDDAVFGGGRDIEVGVSRFSVDRSELVIVNEDIHLRGRFLPLMGIPWCIVGRQLRSLGS